MMKHIFKSGLVRRGKRWEVSIEDTASSTYLGLRTQRGGEVTDKTLGQVRRPINANFGSVRSTMTRAELQMWERELKGTASWNEDRKKAKRACLSDAFRNSRKFGSKHPAVAGGRYKVLLNHAQVSQH
jgi:hypothetical protein